MNPYVVPRDILDKYNTAGPRYTSYPTAPEWRATTAAEAHGWIATNNTERADTPLSLYVHIPFCHQLCYFCGCNMWVTKKEDLVARYMAAVAVEVERMADHIDTRRLVAQIHWGGGTPTYLDSAQISALYGALMQHFTLAPDAEVSLELHPAVTRREQLETLRGLGFNRVSMGIQDFNPAVQAAVNRPQPYEETAALIGWCRELGFASVNVDLMYGLPHQTVDSFAKTLDQVQDLAPDRIALFNYAHVPWLKAHMKLILEETLPTPADKLAIFEHSVETLLARGYRYIGMDHFARADNELATAQAAGTLRRNFMGYTTCADSDLYAFGASSISDLDRAYVQNERNLNDYIKVIESGALPVMRGMPLSDDDRLRREVINRLFCVLAVDIPAVEAMFKIDFSAYFADALVALAPMAEDGLLTVSPTRLQVTPRGQILLRNIAMTFDAYLANKAPGERKFSRTV